MSDDSSLLDDDVSADLFDERSGEQPTVEGPELSVELGEWARSLHGEQHELILEAMVKEAMDMIPGVEAASLSLVSRGGEIVSRVPSSPVPERLDAVQMALQEGPCLDSIREHRIVRVPDMTGTTPWPTFAARAVEAGVRSMLAFQLFVETESLGALNLYSSKAEAFTQDAEDIGWGIAAHAALALANSQRFGQLYEAVASRDLIGQAKGILMERHKISEHEAFLVLSKVSSHENKKLRDIAEDFVHTGALPGIVTD